jgi:hypothetical protein
MSIFTRFISRLRPRRLERDLEDEVEFHIEMRASEYRKAGMNADEATARAHQQFGDIDSVITGMRHARLTSVATLFMMTALFAAVVAFLIAQQRTRSTDLLMPALPATPVVRDLDLSSGSPPPPPPPPTCEEFVAKVKALEINPRSPFDRCGTPNDKATPR